WNGNGYGFYAIPRIGQEVIITYLDGDIDRPLVTGCVYNGDNRVPIDLPKDKTQTVFRTQTHKGDGHNELRFDDATGKEFIHMHAQKDMDIQVRNSKNERVAYNRTSSIGHDEKLVVANNQIITIEQQQDITVKANASEKVEADKSLTVAGDLLQKINGNVSLDSDGEVVLQSNSKMTLKVGNSFIVVHAGGIDINGPQVIAGPIFKVRASGSPSSARSPLAPQLLKSLAGTGTPLVERCTPDFSKKVLPLLSEYQRQFLVKNKQGMPIPNVKYRLTTSDGKVIEGVTDK